MIGYLVLGFGFGAVVGAALAYRFLGQWPINDVWDVSFGSIALANFPGAPGEWYSHRADEGLCFGVGQFQIVIGGMA